MSYDPNNLLGNVIDVLSERTELSTEQIENLIAKNYGEGDFDVAESVLWDTYFGKVIDGIQSDLELEWA